MSSPKVYYFFTQHLVFNFVVNLNAFAVFNSSFQKHVQVSVKTEINV